MLADDIRQWWPLFRRKTVLWLPQLVAALLVSTLGAGAGSGVASPVLLIPILLVAPAVAGGLYQACWQAASTGDTDWAAFARGARTFYLPVVGGFLLLSLAGGVLLMPFVQSGAVTPGPLLALPNPILALASRTTGGVAARLLLTAFLFFLNLWPAALLWDREGILGAAEGSLRQVARHWRPVLSLAMLLWSTTALPLVVSGNGALAQMAGGLLSVLATLVSAFARLLFFVLYGRWRAGQQT